MAILALLATACEHKPSLGTRYVRFNRAIVVIYSDTSTGNGVFIDSNGTIVTAAHAVFDNLLEEAGNGDIAIKHGLSVAYIDADFKRHLEPLKIDSITDGDRHRANYQLALIRTRIRNPVFIPLAEGDTKLTIGEHLIVLAYPFNESMPMIHEGFVSKIDYDPGAEGLRKKDLSPNYPMFHAQMPMVAGDSGAPIINDENHVIGVVESVPMTFGDDIKTAMGFYKSDLNAQYPNAAEQIEKMIGELAVENMATFSSGICVASAISVLLEKDQSPSTPMETKTAGPSSDR